MSDTPLRATVKMNAQGRIVIPAEMRRALGFEPGDELVLTIRDGVMECQTQEQLVRRFLEDAPAALRDIDLQAELARLRHEENRLLEAKGDAKDADNLKARPRKPA
jgi:AbrB family looped-hinge helix DNA binding protein